MSDADTPIEQEQASGSDPVTTALLLRRRLATAPIELPVSGQSMGSTIRSGSTVRLTELTEPRRGEIWAFVGTDSESSTGSGIVVHRVRHLTEHSITGRGDGNRLDDRTVPRSHLIGRVDSATGPDGTIRSFGALDRRLAAVQMWVRAIARGVVDSMTRRPRRPRRTQGPSGPTPA